MKMDDLIKALAEHGIHASEADIKAKVGDPKVIESDQDLLDLVELWGGSSAVQPAKKKGAIRKAVESEAIAHVQGQNSTQPTVNPSDMLLDASNRAMQASVQAVATMGDSTSGLFEKVEQRLNSKRDVRDEQLAEQIAERVFQQENEMLGESFTAMLGYIAEFNPFKGTPLEKFHGASTIDINKMLEDSKT